MADAGSTALRESTTTTDTNTISIIQWRIEPRLRVTPSQSALSSLHELIVRPLFSIPFPFLSFICLLRPSSLIHTHDTILMHDSISPILSYPPNLGLNAKFTLGMTVMTMTEMPRNGTAIVQPAAE
jgi:hypothetical protein